MLALRAHRLVTPAEVVEQPILLVEDGRILKVVSGAEDSVPARAVARDFADAIIAPGYIDLHIHGSAGFDVMDNTDDARPALERFLGQHGVTTYFPTTVTAPIDPTLRALERLSNAIEARRSARPNEGARPLGIHLEGPFISHLRRGVHPPEHLLPPNLATFDRLWQAARGHIIMMTIAPELDGAIELIAEATRRGVCVSLGHSNADFETTQRAIAAGARHATHTFNAMRAVDHRDPGIVGAVLTDSRLTADIIADGIHVDPAMVRLFASAKDKERAVLITDATAAAGMPDGRYHLGSLDVDVAVGRVTANGKLAGSALTLDRAVQNFAQFTGCDLQHAIAAATQIPARVAGLTGKGRLMEGADADFVVLSSAGRVLRTFIGGEEVSA